jgi:hypothetical protein
MLEMDETRIVFGKLILIVFISLGCNSELTLEKYGSQQISIKFRENEKKRLTLMCETFASERKLPLGFIFRGIKDPKNIYILFSHRKFISAKG